MWNQRKRNVRWIYPFGRTIVVTQRIPRPWIVMPLQQPLFPLMRFLALDRVPVIRERKQDFQSFLLRELHDLVETLEPVGTLVERLVPIFDKLEPD